MINQEGINLNDCKKTPYRPSRFGDYWFWDNCFVHNCVFGDGVLDLEKHILNPECYFKLEEPNILHKIMRGIKDRLKISDSYDIFRILKAFEKGECPFLTSNVVPMSKTINEYDFRIIGWFLNQFSIREIFNLRVKYYITPVDYYIFFKEKDKENIEGRLLFCLYSGRGLFGCTEIPGREKISFENVKTEDLIEELNKRGLYLKKDIVDNFIEVLGKCGRGFFS